MVFCIDANVFEWGLLCRVWPLFVIEIPWCLPSRQNDLHDAGAKICLESFQKLFSSDMKRTPSLRPKQELSEGEYQSLLFTLNPLLEFLESLVLDRVLVDLNINPDVSKNNIVGSSG